MRACNHWRLPMLSSPHASKCSISARVATPSRSYSSQTKRSRLENSEKSMTGDKVWLVEPRL
ncbi:hypothetical protein D9M71_796750 [compost metagenome]